MSKKSGNPDSWSEYGIRCCSGSAIDGVDEMTTLQGFLGLDLNTIVNDFKNLPLSFQINISREN